MALLVCNTIFIHRVAKILQDTGIDYFTSWDHAKGKGEGTEPHLGSGPYGSTNSVTMIAFREEAPLEALIAAIKASNKEIQRRADHIRLFQVPMDRIV